MTHDFDGVTEMLNDYFDGLYHSDTKILGRVFHSQGALSRDGAGAGKSGYG